MAEEKVALRQEQIEWRALGDEIVALDLETSTYLTVNDVGATVWPLLAEGATRREMLDAVLARFAVDEATAGRDLDAFVGDLRARGLLATSAA